MGEERKAWEKEDKGRATAATAVGVVAAGRKQLADALGKKGRDGKETIREAGCVSELFRAGSLGNFGRTTGRAGGFARNWSEFPESNS